MSTGSGDNRYDDDDDDELMRFRFGMTDPGFPDKVGFGRRLLAMNPEQAYAEM